MKHFNKVVAALLVAVLSVCLFSTAAFAASENDRTGAKTVALAKKALEDIDTDDLYTGNIDDPVLVYYASQPFTQPIAFLNWMTDAKKRQSPDFEGTMQDLGVGVVSRLGGYFAKNYASKTLTTLQDASYDIADGLKNAPADLTEKLDKYAPILSDVYKMTGPVGEITLQAVLLPGYLATNAGALAFVLIGGGAALVVIFGLTGILTPLLALEQGPQTIDQFFRDLNEFDQAMDAAK